MTTTNKSSVSETGHAINVANFETLITYCIGYGAIYNPAMDAIKIPQLQAKETLLLQKLAEAEAKRALFNTATNERITAFSGLEVLCTKATNAFAVSGAPIEEIRDLQAINKKIQGPGKKKESTGVSTSQQSYDSKRNFFANFIQYLESKPIYNPNEEELQIPKLQAKLEQMKVANKNVDVATFEYNKALNSRNDEMYNPTSGLVQISKDVKKYARSIFGASSPEFQQLNNIQFRVAKG